MHRGARQILLTQLLLTGAVALLMLCVRSPAMQAGFAAAFGGAMAIINTLLLARRTRYSSVRGVSPRIQSMRLFLGVIERFAFTLVAFGVGMGYLRLDPLALLVAFGCAQLGYVIAGARAQMSGAATTEEFESQRADS